ncbi:phage major capsid protein [Bacillus thuringiensis]|nr:phage major capsid protein [Bacillus thuringiensis]MCU5280090.1 phage major capsid protein [Bacillus cereus]AMR87638.1 major capsid protein [Bacillus thuringiensis]KIP23166.1 phage major capsid protein, HK97 family [Bacillus thuringiensis serovar morrisoni]MBG9639572.1 primosomal replication protein N [Bacillus thuringiensis]MBG9671094.1 primosomal replication protein N [Bacillus thuringiensis]
MNRQLLLALQKRSNERLVELRTQVENPELRAEDLPAIQEEIDEINKQLQEVADALANLEDDGEGEEGNGDDEEGTGESGTEGSGEGGEGRTGTPEGGENRTGLTAEQRQSAMAAIATGLSTRGHKTTKKKEKEIRSAFANFVVGRISEAEARSLGIEAGNGSVTIPEVIASEIITYAQEENLLRKYGSVHKTAGDMKYPVLVKKADANVRKKERKDNDEIVATDIEFDEVLLDPAEFDALATVTKKLLKMTGAPIEQIVVDELKKAYVRKEINYMFNGDDVGNENPGALAKKAVAFKPSNPVDLKAKDAGQLMYDALVEMKNTPVTEVMKKGRWIINRAALTAIEKMKTTDGFPLLRPMTQVEGGIGNTLIGYPVDFTDAADVKGKPDVPVLYFGDISAFHIQDVIGAMELQKLIEKFAGTNKVGFQIYNLLDGQLVYSPFEPAVYRFEVQATTEGK